MTRKRVSRAGWLLLCLVVMCPRAYSENWQDLQYDVQGNAMYSRYNFTDVKHPYDGMDAWAELKAAYWLDEGRMLAPFVSIIPVYTSADQFWWQRHIQGAAGLQWYVLPERGRPDWLRPLRFYAQAAFREYYDEEDDADPQKDDLQIGVDYYHDRLFTDQLLVYSVFVNAGYRATNFSLEDYDAFLWMGNMKLGPGLRPGNSIVFPYGIIDWTHSPSHDDRWWENFLRCGAGISFYPRADHAGGFWSRFRVYGEVLWNVEWLVEEAPSDVEEMDVRAGVAFATGGFFRE